MNRQRLILFVLVILFGVAALWSYSAIPQFKTVSPTQARQEPQARPVTAAPDKPAGDADDGTILNVGELDAPPDSFTGYQRDIFKPIFSDETKIVKPKPVIVKPPPPKAPPPVQAPPVIVKPETAPLARFTFLGFINKRSVRTIFLSKDKDILLVKKGDTIAGRYEATNITDKALTLTTTDTKEELVIQLVENQTLVPSR